MGLIRRMFGPSKEEIWRQLSAEVDGRFVEGGWWKGDKVQVSHGSWTLTLDTYTVSTGKVNTTYTRMRAPFVNATNFRFTVYRSGFFSNIGVFFGMQDVRVGHDPFDRDFVIQGTSETKLCELFASPRIRELISSQPQIHFSVKDDEGWFGAKFPEKVDELYFSSAGIIKDVERLRLLYDLFAETLDELCRMGVAQVNDPGVEL